MSDAQTTETVTETPVTVEPTRAERLEALDETFRTNSAGRVTVSEPEELVVEAVNDPVVEPEIKTPEVKPPVDEFTERFKQLSDLEARLREREVSLKEQEASGSKADELAELRSLAKTDPLKVAEALGISLSDLANQSVDQEGFVEKVKTDEALTRIQKLEESQKQAAKDREEQGARQYANNIASQIESSKEEFPMVVGLNGGVQMVLNTITQYYEQSGKELPWKEAAAKTESYILEQKALEYEALLKIEKFKSKLSPSTTTAPLPTVPSAPAEAKTKTINTISNRTASAPADRQYGQKVSREERERRINELAENLFSKD